MSASEVNIPLLRKAVEWAEAEAAKPEGGLWDQSWYITDDNACGTSYCIAGWVNVQNGAEGYDQITDTSAAAESLGIPVWRGEDGHLFDGGNSIEDVRRIAEEIAGERL
jgi:hypothetical protein